MSVDTLSLARELRAAEIAPSQAEAIGRAVVETSATKADLMELRAATKADLGELRAATKADLGELRAATKADVVQLGTELRGELVHLGSELRGEIGKLGGDLRVEIERSRNQLVMWFVGIQIALGGIIVAIIKLVPAQGF